MELAVIVGHGGLLGMGDAGENGHAPQEPRVLVEEGDGDVLAEDDGDVYGCKPEVAAQAVEYASEARILVGEAGELSVGAVE